MYKKIDPSKYNKRIEIWGKVSMINELLENDFENGKIKTIWSSIVPQTAKLQTQQADTIVSNTTHKITCRYSAAKDIKQDNWIVFNGKRFDINYILNPFEANVELEIFAENKVE